MTVDIINKILIGVAFGLIIGTLWAIHTILIKVWSTLKEIEYHLRNKR